MKLLLPSPALLIALSVSLAGPTASFGQPADRPRFTPEIETFVENFKPGGHDLAGQIELLPPEESRRRLRPLEGYAVELAAHEPVIRQPIDMRFDERGRLWVVQYLQYPFPAGLTISAYDQYLRAAYDGVSLPPPNHTRGADKITIMEDRDNDGKYETHKTFVDGLNLATSLAFGYGGVWVLQSPYLLFYPDRNGDDIPDGDPEVHLSGFGLEDTHSLASSLHMGPDGWIYGATGSTTNLEIQGIRLLGQGIWRYHPDTKVFEVFAEGGGNTVSFEFDKYGRAYSGTNSGATRGPHYVQGATYGKGWTKHGPAMNPFLYGFFDSMAHQGYTQRFPQTFLFYEGGLMPKIEGHIVVGMSLTNRVQTSEVFKDTSTFRTIDRDVLVDSEDKAFRPVDIESGPDGAIYVADWYDARLSHLNPKDTWEKATGRIYRIVPWGYVRPPIQDLRKASTAELVRLLTHSNRWYRETSRRLLAQRPEPLGPTLQGMLGQKDDAALEALWVLNLRGELEPAQLRDALAHPNEHVRRWAVRLLGDRNSVSADVRTALIALARQETAVEVRSQLASTARRLPAGQAFPIIRQLLARDEDAADKHIPLLLWWAIESKADSGREEIAALMSDADVWKTKIFSQHIAERVAMRYAADQGPRKYYTLQQGVYSGWLIDRSPEFLKRNLEMCARLLAAAPNEAAVDVLVAGMAAGLAGGPVPDVPKQLQAIFGRLWSSRTHNAPLVALAARLGIPEAMSQAIAMVKGGNLNEPDQLQLLDLFAATGAPEALPLVTTLLRQERNEQRRTRLLATLEGFASAEAAATVLDLYPTFSPRLQIVAQRMLSEKPAWSLAMLQRMNQGTFTPGVLSSANLTAIRAHGSPQITALLTSYQNSASASPQEKMAAQLYEQGRTAYALNCAACHQENGQGLIGLAPSLVASPWVQKGEDFVTRIVLHGKEDSRRGFVMPPLKHLDDSQIAAAVTYVRREFGNQPGMTTPAKVTTIRSATNERQKAWNDQDLAGLAQ